MARDMARLENPKSAYDGLRALLTSEASTVGVSLGLMSAIDEALSLIHPRIQLRAKGRRAIPPWMAELRDRRITTGSLLDAGDLRLVLRGPLLRVARDPAASSADSLADRFSYLTCARTELDENGRKITVSMRCFGMDLLQGVEPVAEPGRERIAFLPVAEIADDLAIEATSLNGKVFAKYGPASHLDCAQRIVSALGAEKNINLALAPELVMSADQLEALAGEVERQRNAPNLLLAGTYNTDELRSAQSFNEASLINAAGCELWRQRKLWPASMDAARAAELGLGTGSGDQVFEDNAAGDDLIVADMDGFGRVVVLICQDVKLSCVTQLIHDYQPDWVLMPILDHGFSVGRWAHARAFALSEESQSRFVGVTSTSLAYRLSKPVPVQIGMAVGPAYATGEDGERAHAFVLSTPGRSPACGVVAWREGTVWETTIIGATR